MDDLSQRHALACHVAREAGMLAMEYFCRRDELTVDAKGVQDWVSEADREVESLIRSRLAETFPRDGILGEEEGWQPGESAGYWVIDPIDGTTNFLRGLPDWGVVLAYVEQDQVQVGVTYAPIHELLYSAVRGQGAELNDQPLKRKEEAVAPDSALIYLGFGARNDLPAYKARLDYLYSCNMDQRRLGSAALALARTADGRVDGFFESRINLWDVAAGLLIVEEAGGWHNYIDRPLPRGEKMGVLACDASLETTLMPLFEIRG
ncbi:inositol monophosphatase family protein [Pokkaliibacter sp. CJK22405]|uniref:inositol monophosphatase family protein n=1 Tax=Pokkaliibacter sp. CJK22405 TaxID=3384615 RepID=UPI003984F085